MNLQKQIILEACDLIAHYPEDDNLFKEQLWIIYKAAKELYSDEISTDAKTTQEIKDYVDKQYDVEWDKMGNTGEDGYWENASRNEIYHFGRFRAFEDIKYFIEIDELK